MELRVLTWNLKHGRSVPGAGRELLPEFTAALDGWSWDVALLQEVPPWWPEQLAAKLRAQFRSVLTSRNALLALRRSVARRAPDLIKSGGGGANAILVRGGHTIVAHRGVLLRRLPERRRMHAVRLQEGVWLGNLHAQGTRPEAERAAAALLKWCAGSPAVLGGDFNLAQPRPAHWAPAGGHGVDLLFSRGLQASAPAEVLDRGSLSDHAPVAVSLRSGSCSAGVGG